jgi:hyperosmotically inducible periplasmic protein
MKSKLLLPLALLAAAAMPLLAQADPGDKAITDQVRATLGKTPGLGGLDIHVRTIGGVVRLTGTVPSGVQVDQAESAASKVPGVKEINNELDPRVDS